MNIPNFAHTEQEYIPMNTSKITVRVEGRCPTGHLVFHNLPITVVPGSHGLATASTDCPSCGKPTQLTGTY